MIEHMYHEKIIKEPLFIINKKQYSVFYSSLDISNLQKQITDHHSPLLILHPNQIQNIKHVVYSKCSEKRIHKVVEHFTLKSYVRISVFSLEYVPTYTSTNIS
jgi:hypothetical protein